MTKPKAPEDLKKRGRHSLFQPEYIIQGAKLCRLGATDADMADFFGISVDTLNEWRKANPEFAASLKAAKDALDAQVEQSLFRRAMGYEHPAVKIFNHQGVAMTVDYTERYPPDTTAMIFWLKNRQREKWRDKQDVEHSASESLADLIAKSFTPANDKGG